MTGRRISDQRLLRFKRVDTDFILRVDADQFVGAKLYELRRGLPWKCKDNHHPPLTEDIDLTTSILRITGAHRKQRLNGIVCERADLRIYTTSRKLCVVKAQQSVNRSKQVPGAAETYIIEDEQIRRQAFGQVLLDTGLLASQELSHGCQAARRLRRRKEAKGRRDRLSGRRDTAGDPRYE